MAEHPPAPLDTGSPTPAQRAAETKRSHQRKPGNPPGPPRTPAGAPRPAASAGRAPHRPAPKLTAAEAKSVKSGLAMALTGADLLAATLAPTAWTAEDRLAAEETALLVRGIYAELECYPSALHWLATASAQGVHVQLAYAVLMVAVPRMARRGLIPPDVALAFAVAGAGFIPAEGVAAGPAPSASGEHGNGQIDPSQLTVEYAPVGRDPAVETG